MPLPTPNLDDRTFQDIVDEAKRSITRYCPEWTDHNVSDPGVTLIELFASMTEMLLYRVNQVPDKLYTKFLELVGVRLNEPQAATAPITFYLSAPLPDEKLVVAGTEVATVRTETSEPIIFTTETNLMIRPSVLRGAVTRSARRGSFELVHEIEGLGLPGTQPIAIFPPQPDTGDGFYLLFERDLSNHVIELIFDCEVAGSTGIDPRKPPTEWQVWQGGITKKWSPCEVEYDTTGGFNAAGNVLLHLPAMSTYGELKLNGASEAYYCLRCVLSEAQRGPRNYKASPRVISLRADTRGATTTSRHAITVSNEFVGVSDGTAGQTFRLKNVPLLARDPDRDVLLVQPPGELEAEQVWQEVADFADSTEKDCHYTLDSIDGTLTFGPSLLQPDGNMYSFGAVPPRGSRLVFSRYQHGGGITGNVLKGTLSVLKSSIPYISQVINRADAIGGRNAQSIEDAKMRVPSSLRTRTRAVTSDDFEYLARQVPYVARACCLGPGAQPGESDAPKPGTVVVYVLPDVEKGHESVLPEQLVLSPAVSDAVMDHLDKRRLLGTKLEIKTPGFVWISIRAKLRVPQRSSQTLRDRVQQTAELAIYRYLNPYMGGPEGTGWPFGRELYLSELASLLQRVPYVDFVENIQVFLEEPGTNNPQLHPRAVLPIKPFELICSNRHSVEVV